MFPPYRFETCHALNLTYETEKRTSANEYHSPSGVTTEDYGFGTQRLEDSIQSSAGAPLASTYVPWYPVPLPNMSTLGPMSPTYRSALDLEMEALFGTDSRTTDAIRVPLNDIFAATEDNRPGAELENVIQTPEIVQLDEVHLHITTAQIAHSCLATSPCQWTGEGISETCGAPITCQSAPAHFGSMHSIRKLREDALIYCWWEGCDKRVKRKYFVRHIRERHLRHLREKKHP
ncbi:hypothetical protein OG21DRAFT_447367 [Imleria badia]|nr:hypothetical protein OG21DRAFT_447367 [Imleria badia]